jgi:hypothetical protein
MKQNLYRFYTTEYRKVLIDSGSVPANFGLQMRNAPLLNLPVYFITLRVLGGI